MKSPHCHNSTWTYLKQTAQKEGHLACIYMYARVRTFIHTQKVPPTVFHTKQIAHFEIEIPIDVQRNKIINVTIGCLPTDQLIAEEVFKA